MTRAWPVLAALCCGAAWGAAPFYSAASIVNVGNFSPGPFAPNSILTIFGNGLATTEHVLKSSDISGNQLPVKLDYTQVFMDGLEVPLLYVGPTQINFLVPSNQTIGPSVIWVTREGWAGPKVTVQIAAAAPALFENPNAAGYAIASHRDYTVVSSGSPAKAGEVIVLWATGLGKTSPNPPTGEIPPYIAEIVNRPSLTVTVGGDQLDAARILYAGQSPGSAGLYQINLELPGNCGTDPEIRVAIGAQTTPAGLKLAVR